MLVAALAVAWLLPQQPSLQYGADRIALHPDGSLGRRSCAPTVPGAEPRRWRLRVHLARRLEIESGGRIGVTALDERESAAIRAACLDAAARFDAACGGAARLVPEFVTIAAPLRVLRAPGTALALVPTREQPLGCSGRDADGVLFCYDPGHEPLAMLGGTFGQQTGPDGVPASGIAWVPLRWRATPPAEVVLHEWLHQIEAILRARAGMPWLPGVHDWAELGYASEAEFLPDLIRWFVGAEPWRSADPRRDAVVRRESEPPACWPSIAADPWRRLPCLGPRELAGLTGRSELGLEAEPGFVRATGAGFARGGSGLDHQLDLAAESVLRIPGLPGAPEPALLLVRADLGDLFADWGGGRLLGIALPEREHRQAGGWDSGGTATPLYVFASERAVAARHELELLAPSAGAARIQLAAIGDPPVAGTQQVSALRLDGPAATQELRARTANGGVELRGDGAARQLVWTPAAAGPSLVVVAAEGLPPLPIAQVVQPEFELQFAADSGPPVVTRAAAPFTLRITNRGRAPQACAIDAWLPPDLVAAGLPDELIVTPGEPASIAVALTAEADRPAGPVELRFVARAGERVLGELHQELWLAPGRDAFRLGFERRRRGERRATPASHGEWRFERSDGDAGAGAGHLRVDDGGGSRHGRIELWQRAPATFDTKSFPWLTVELRASEAAPHAALMIDVGRGVVAIPLGAAGAGTRPQLAPIALPADRRWHRIAYPIDQELERVLGPGSYRIGSISIGDARPQVSNRWRDDDAIAIDVDELALVREPALTPGDLLRDLTERYVADGPGLLWLALPWIDPAALGPQDLVDHALLEHALAWHAAETALPPRERQQPVGRERFVAMLRHQHHLAFEPEELIELGWREIRLHQQQLDQLASRMQPGAGWRDVAARLRERHPTAEQLPEFARGAMQSALEFTIARRLVTVPHAARDARVQVVTSGELSRTYPFGGYGGVRRSPSGFTGTYFVSPPADWMTPDEAAERLRGNHEAWTRVVALHEIVPGHHLQTVVHELRPLSDFRRSFYSTVFAEGWALYCEEMMWAAGFFADDAARFAQLWMRLWRAARVVIDASLQLGRMSIAEAERLLIDEAELDPVNARAEVRRYIDNPTRPMSYLIGFRLLEQLVADARARDGARFRLAEFHDRLLAFGPVPLPAIRRALGLGAR